MPRSAPTVDGTPNIRSVTLHLIDNSGDTWAENIEIGIAELPATIEALVADYATRTHADIYRVTDHLVYNAPAQSSNATTGEKSPSVKDGINFLFLSNTNESEDVRLVAPVASMMVGTTDTVDPTEGAEFGAVVEPLLTGTRVLISSQYTQRKEKKNNPKTRY